MTVAKKPWIEMSEMERFADDLEGLLLAHADPKDVAAVMYRLWRAVALEREAAVDEATEHAPDFGSDA